MTPRLTKSVGDMAVFCPDLVYRPDALTEGGWWTGELRPLRSVENLLELLDDIHHHHPIYTAWRGELRHVAKCKYDHHRHDWMGRVRAEEVLRPFLMRVYYGGGHGHPRCWVDGVNAQNAQHLWDDGSLCPFMASEDAWVWTHHTVADFIGHLSVWLVSWMLWQQAGIWLVGEHASTPGYHLDKIRPNEQCWCRSGKKYRKCHMQTDQITFFKCGR
jgi:hypothetical protein